MTKGRKTTQEERAKIAAFCIEHNYDYGLTVETYKVSYNQIYAWVRKYEEGGADKLGVYLTAGTLQFQVNSLFCFKIQPYAI